MKLLIAVGACKDKLHGFEVGKLQLVARCSILLYRKELEVITWDTFSDTFAF